ncbi:hypothetical protein ACFT9I_19370 [Streptomyces sp. NPDC057137]|uniref:hypothetical protein n=1 Tax=Streptomyces sp. NPDC057137 TaxID=3346030 RepID=UPI00362AF086
MYGVERTGVRFVMSSPSDPDRIGDYHAWYDVYGTVVTHLGHLVNCFRFENPAAAGSVEDPRSVAIYDIVTPDPATAWPATESSEGYPRYLYDDPRAQLVSPAMRGSWAHVGSLAKNGSRGAVTGVHIILSDGADDASRERWASQVLDTGLFYAASRLKLIEEAARGEALVNGRRISFPEPPTWLEIFETDQRDPLTAYPRTLEALAGSRRAAEIEQRQAGSFTFYSGYQAAH